MNMQFNIYVYKPLYRHTFCILTLHRSRMSWRSGLKWDLLVIKRNRARIKMAIMCLLLEGWHKEDKTDTSMCAAEKICSLMIV